MRIRLTRKLANYLDGIDVSNHDVGDVIDLPAGEAHLLVAEQWATPERRSGEPVRPSTHRRRAGDVGQRAADDPRLSQAS